MYNKVIIAGHLSKDIELRYTQGGSAIAKTAIATTRKFKGSDGVQKEEVLFVDITFFGRTAEVVNQYLRKGSKLLIDGRLKLEQWTAQDGTKRSKHSIAVENLTMLDSKNESHTEPTPQQTDRSRPPAGEKNRRTQPYQPSPQESYTPADTEPPHPVPKFPDMDEDDEIPF